MAVDPSSPEVIALYRSPFKFGQDVLACASVSDHRGSFHGTFEQIASGLVAAIKSGDFQMGTKKTLRITTIGRKTSSMRAGPECLPWNEVECIRNLMKQLLESASPDGRPSIKII